jgi:BirA family biotin operon repressor/biotin-[acetyl-CoA-carboxylase] ligase
LTVKNLVLARLEKMRGKLVSGVELARESGVSRNAVWKAVRELRKAGYRIESRRNGGYRMEEDNDILSAAGMAPYLNPELEPGNILVFSSLTSTNDVAKEKALAGAAAGTIIIADEQTGGKGRMGRSYYSPAGAGIYLSILLRPRLAGSQALLLTTGAAVAAAQAIESLWEGEVKIKWVNDLYVKGKKISGILTDAITNLETGLTEYVVLGIGINVKPGQQGFPQELVHKAGTLCPSGNVAPDEGGQQSKKLLRNPLAAQLVNQIWRMARELEEQPVLTARRLIAEARRRSCLLGRQILVEGHEVLKQAKAVDIDESGFLIAEDQEGRRYVLNGGEVSLRGAEEYNW